MQAPTTHPTLLGILLFIGTPIGNINEGKILYNLKHIVKRSMILGLGYPCDCKLLSGFSTLGPIHIIFESNVSK